MTLRRRLALALATASFAACAPRSPLPEGPVVTRRLSLRELDRTLHDLTGEPLGSCRELGFPEDPTVLGFDVFADALSIGPTHVSRLEPLAARVVERAWESDLLDEESFRYAYTLFEASAGEFVEPDLWRLPVGASIRFERDEPDTATLGLWTVVEGANRSGRVEYKVDGRSLGTFATLPEDGEILAEFESTRGRHVFEMTLLDGPPEGLELVYLVVTRLAGPRREAEAIVRVCEPEGAFWTSCADRILARFMTRAFRRPLEWGEQDPFVKLAERVATELQQDGVAEHEARSQGVRTALRAVLLSPGFLFRFEPAAGGAPPGAHVVASRLSYLLWASMPDDALVDDARSGRLGTRDGVLAAVDRLLEDSKSEGFLDGFVAQWLWTRGLLRLPDDPAWGGAVDDALARALVGELKSLVAAALLDDAPLTHLLETRSADVDPVLAAHYGLPAGPDGARRVQLPAERAGITGRAGVLAATSFPARTSPTRRGRWILTQLLCEPIGNPPPEVAEALPDDTGGSEFADLLAAHSSREECASCHRVLDPLGLSLESFDQLGRARTPGSFAGGGQAPDGNALPGNADLARWLADADRFRACLARHLSTYALGRSPDLDELAWVQGVVRALGPAASFRDVVRAVAAAPFFAGPLR